MLKSPSTTSGLAAWWVLRSQAVNASSQRSFSSYSGAPGLPAVHHVDVDDPFYPLAYGGENRMLRLLADAKIVVTPAVRNM
jgi:hypothetical protein